MTTWIDIKGISELSDRERKMLYNFTQLQNLTPPPKKKRRRRRKEKKERKQREEKMETVS